MNVVLIQPGNYKSKPVEIKPSLGLAYLAASLELDGHKVKVLDIYGSQKSIEEMLLELKQFKPDLCGFTVVTPSVHSVSDLSSHIKENFDIPIVVGGPHPSAIPDRTLNDFPNLDIAVFGEGEQTVRELVNTLEGTGDLSLVKGISYRNKGNIVKNDPRPLIGDLDSIPFPAWHLLDMDKYHELSKKNMAINGNIFSIITSRGCPSRCTFCDTHTIWTRKCRERSPDNVVDEIETLYKKYDVKYLFFWDDTFVINKERAIEVCDQIIDRDIRIKWECHGRVNFVDEKVLTKMKEAGCHSMGYGIESGSQETLNYIKKGITLEQAKRAIEITKKVGLETNAFWMIGFPNEKEEDIRKTIELNKSLPLDVHDTFSLLTPFPGTDLYKDMKKEGLILHEDWSSYFNRRADDIKPFIKTRYLSGEELFRLQRRANKEIRVFNYNAGLKKLMMRPDKFLIKLVKNPDKFIRAIKKVSNFYMSSS